MTPAELAAAYGLLSQGLLAVLFARMARAMRQRWAGILALAFALHAAYDVRVWAGIHVDAIAAVPQAGNAALVLAGLVACTCALVEGTGVHGAAARRMMAAAAGVGVAALAAVLAHGITRRGGLAVWSAFVLAWALLFLDARRREPRHGHALVALSLCTWPAAVAAVMHGDLAPEGLVAAHAITMTALGATLLATVVMREHERARGDARRAHAQQVARQLAEARLRQANETLERRVAARTEELRRTIDGLHGLPGADRAFIDIAPMPDVDADATLLRQVFANLVGNALKFASGAAYPRIEIGATAGADGPVFHVRDNGIGFTPDAAATLFQPFHRLHGPRFEGFGVGLSIVKRIVERHGGRVWAEARPDGGAAFRFTLASPDARLVPSAGEQILPRGLRAARRAPLGDGDAAP